MGVKKLLERLSLAGVTRRVRLEDGGVTFLDEDDDSDREGGYTGQRQRQRQPSDAAGDNNDDNGGPPGPAPPTTSTEARTRGARRRARAAVDASAWIASACHGNGSMLLDERSLTNYGRSQSVGEDDRRRRRGTGGDGDGDDDDVERVDGDAAREAAAASGGGPKDPQRGGATLSATGNGGNGVPPSYEDLKARREEQYVNRCARDVLDKILLLRDECRLDVLVVFDGATPPAKTDVCTARRQRKQTAERLKSRDDADAPSRIRAARHAGASPVLHSRVVSTLLSHLRSDEHHVPFLVSPHEADGQLAYLSRRGLVDIVVSDDSDLVGCGVEAVVFKLDASRRTGVLVRRRDLGAAMPTSFDLLNFSDTMLAVLCVTAGCDYCDNLPGIGIVTARNVVASIFRDRRGGGGCGGRRCQGSEEEEARPLLDRFFAHLYASARGGRAMSRQAKDRYERMFLRALLMFLHPVVFDPLTQQCAFAVHPGDHPNPDLADYPPYSKYCANPRMVEEVVGNILSKERAIHVAEGWVDPRAGVLRDRAVTPRAVMRTFEQSSGRPETPAFAQQPEPSTDDSSAKRAGPSPNVCVTSENIVETGAIKQQLRFDDAQKGNQAQTNAGGKAVKSVYGRDDNAPRGSDEASTTTEVAATFNLMSRPGSEKASHAFSQNSTSTGSASKISSQLSSQPSTAPPNSQQPSPELLPAAPSPVTDAVAPTQGWARTMLTRLIGSGRKRTNAQLTPTDQTEGQERKKRSRTALV